MAEFFCRQKRKQVPDGMGVRACRFIDRGPEPRPLVMASEKGSKTVRREYTARA